MDKEVRLICNHIKKGTLINLNGYFLYIAGLDSRKNVEFHNATSLCLSNSLAEYIHLIEKSHEKKEVATGINKENNFVLYDNLSEKFVTTSLKNYPRSIGNTLAENKNKFTSLEIGEQTEILYKLLNVTSLGKGENDLSIIGLPKDLGRIRIPVNAEKADKLMVINQSISGLLENRIDLLNS